MFVIIFAEMLVAGDKALSAEKWMFDQSEYNTINGFFERWTIIFIR